MLTTFKALTRMPSRAVSETAFGPLQVDGHAVRRRGPNLDEAIEELRQITESSNDGLLEAAGITTGSWYAWPSNHVG
jgi:hypothetical protein